MESPSLLRMEAYKSLNRELTVKNQELRQYAGTLREELTLLRRKLVEEREGQQEMKRSIVGIVTEAFNMVLKLLFPENVENELSSNLSLLGSSLKNIANQTAEGMSPVNTAKNSAISKNPISPLSQVNCSNNITQRNRRQKEQRNDMEAGEPQYEFGLDERDEVEGESDTILSLPAITEEDLTLAQRKSITSFMDISSGVDEENDRMSKVCTRRKKEKICYSAEKSTEKSLTFSSEEEVSGRSREVSGVNNTFENVPKNVTEIQESILSESNFNNFSITKATSSTPYKRPGNSKNLRNVKVVVPRLTRDILIKYGVSIDAATISNIEESSLHQHTKRISRKDRDVQQVSQNYELHSRPKRRAAQVASSTLIEPSIRTKLRRPDKN